MLEDGGKQKVVDETEQLEWEMWVNSDEQWVNSPMALELPPHPYPTPVTNGAHGTFSYCAVLPLIPFPLLMVGDTSPGGRSPTTSTSAFLDNNLIHTGVQP